MEAATEDLGALFDAVEQRWQVLRTASSGDRGGRKKFKKFIRAPNHFHGTLTELNDTLYAAKNALILSELLDMDG